MEIRHCRRTMDDFWLDQNRFIVITETGRYAVTERGGGCFFKFDNEPGEKEQREITGKVMELVRKNEYKWSFPEQAYKVADDYCREEFV